MQLLEEKAKTAARRRLNTATGWVDSERAHLCASLQVSIMRRQLARVDAAIHDLQYLTTSKMLLRVGPAEARRKDRAGRLPLHWAEACRAPDPIKQLLTSVFPAGSTETDDSNSTPAMLRPAVDRAALVAETAQDEFKGCKNCRGPATVLCMWSQLADHEKHLARKLGWGPHSWDQVHCCAAAPFPCNLLPFHCVLSLHFTASFPCLSLPSTASFPCTPLPSTACSLQFHYFSLPSTAFSLPLLVGPGTAGAVRCMRAQGDQEVPDGRHCASPQRAHRDSPVNSVGHDIACQAAPAARPGVPDAPSGLARDAQRRVGRHQRPHSRNRVGGRPAGRRSPHRR